jgi:hypothetical protein
MPEVSRDPLLPDTPAGEALTMSGTWTMTSINETETVVASILLWNCF